MKIISKDKKQKIKSVHHSIKTQMITSFVGLLICLVVTLMFINGKFLEPYYISKKESRFIELYEKLNDVSNEDKWDSTKKNNSLIHFAEKNNISYLVIEKDNDVHTNVHDKNMLKNQMMGYFLNQAQKESRTLDSTDVYQINQSWDPWNQSYYVDMWGSLDDGSQFLLRSPVESMRESASISNRFLLYIGSVLIVVSILLIWYFSKRITDPIRELARLSDRMADLDFDAKYTSGGSNEIGELGENFNRMSEKLESTISELKKANNSLQKDIEQKDKLEKMRNEFLGNVSHELKTPIALIQGYAEGLKEGVNEDAESREFYCDVIMDEASKMNQMVKNLLTLNQLEFGDEDIVFEHKTERVIPDTEYHDMMEIPKMDGEYIYGKNDLFAVIIIFKILLNKKAFRLMMKEIEYEIELLDGRVDTIPISKVLDRMGFPENYIEIIDIMKREELAVLNTISTAEGAIEIAISNTNKIIHGSEVLILGFGRIGKVLARKMAGLSAKVTCAARKDEDLAWIRAYGHKETNINALGENLSQYDIILNTVPHLVLNKERLQYVKKDALLIDLASNPGGIDKKEARELNLKLVWALALPGKVAPVTTAEFIKDTIYNILKEIYKK
mgnify:CR=1 FL=1